MAANSRAQATKVAATRQASAPSAPSGGGGMPVSVARPATGGFQKDRNGVFRGSSPADQQTDDSGSYGKQAAGLMDEVASSNFQRDQSALGTQSRQSMMSGLQGMATQAAMDRDTWKRQMEGAAAERAWQTGEAGDNFSRQLHLALIGQGKNGGGSESTSSLAGTGYDPYAADANRRANRAQDLQELQIRLGSADDRYRTFLPLTQSHNFQYWG